MGDIAVVYYSRTGKSRAVAGRLGELLGADVEEVREQKTRGGAIGWLGACKDAVFKKPATLLSSHNTEGRSTVVVVMPVWAGSPPPAIRTYLQQADLKGRKVCAVVTFDGGGDKSCLERIAELLPEGLAERLSLKKPKMDDPDLQATLAEWAGKIGLDIS